MCPVGIFRTDADGRYLTVNAHWSEITGLASAEALGQGWAQALHPDDRDRVAEEWNRAMRENRNFASEYRLQRPDGAVIPVLGQALAERDARGEIIGFIGAVADRTREAQLQKRLRDSAEKHKRAEADLGIRNEQLRCLATQLALAQEEERRRIAMGLHDEVGQRLAIARAKLGQLLETGAHDGGAGLAVEICALVDRVIAETRSLTFELSSPVLHELGLAAALESLCEQLGKDSGIRFRVEAAREPESLARDLRILLYRSARELCLNVVKHARASAAEVRLHNDKDWVQIVVADQGEGFDASARHFGPAGGFGLFALQEIASRVGGRFEIESAAGRGTRAALSVPLG